MTRSDETAFTNDAPTADEGRDGGSEPAFAGDDDIAAGHLGEPVDQLLEGQREQSGVAGDELAKAVDRHRDDFGLPPEPADGEDARASES